MLKMRYPVLCVITASFNLMRLCLDHDKKKRKVNFSLLVCDLYVYVNHVKDLLVEIK